MGWRGGGGWDCGWNERVVGGGGGGRGRGEGGNVMPVLCSVGRGRRLYRG